MSTALVMGLVGAVAGGGYARSAEAITLPSPLSTPSLPTLPVPTPSLPNLVPTPSLPSILPSPSLSNVLPSPSLPNILPSPSLLNILPSPSLPLPSVTPSLPIPSPSVPLPTGSPAPGVAPSSGGVGQPSARPSQPQTVGQRNVAYNSTPGNDPKSAWIVIPGIAVPADPIGVALLVAIAALPVLAAIGLIVLGRFWGTALSRRSSRLRMALAAELELSPRELAALTPAGLVKLRDQVAFDELTGVLRRVAGIAAAEREFARARRMHTPLSAVFVDLDGLKRVNDSRGHQAGDAFIRGVAINLRDSLRGQDLVFRYGGDEFVCILPGVGEEAVEEKFNHLRAQAVDAGTPFGFGVAELRPHEDLVGFLGRADQRLYEQRSERKASLDGGRLVPMPAQPSPSRGGARRRSI